MIYAPAQRLAPDGEQSFIPGRFTGRAGQESRSERETRNPGVSSPALVPYESVFSRYREAAGSALEREEVPARWRDYVRSYFEQLEPR